MRILVVGASGFIGRHLVPVLLQRHQLLWAARTPPDFSHPSLTYVPVDLARDTDSRDWLHRLDDVDVVINAAGILREHGMQTFDAIHVRAPAALFDACAQRRIHRVIQLSALGADEQAQSAYHLSKKAADDHLRKLRLSSVVVQPSLVFGADGSSAELFCQLAALPLVPVPGRGLQQVQPVHIDDLVDLICVLVESPQVPAQIAATGPRAITLRDYLREMRNAMSLSPARFLPVPMPLVRLDAAAARWLPGSLIDNDSVQMLERGNTSSCEPMAALLGRAPRDYAQFIRNGFEATALRQRALLGCLLPMLRISVALVWIVTGLVSAFVYPVDASLQLLARTGIHGASGLLALYGAAMLDLAFGVLTLFMRSRWLWIAQITLILAYTLVITLRLPEFWSHPYGPLLKNLPMLAAIFLLMSFERR